MSALHGIFGALREMQFPATQDPVATAEPVSKNVPIQSEEVKTQSASATAKVGQIAVDIYEVDNYFVIRAPIAGVRLGDLEIEAEGKQLTIRGVRRPNEAVEKAAFYLEECYWGEFKRSVSLPCNIDVKKVKATFSKDCILKVLVPKEEKIKIVRISEGG